MHIDSCTCSTARTYSCAQSKWWGQRLCCGSQSWTLDDEQSRMNIHAGTKACVYTRSRPWLKLPVHISYHVIIQITYPKPYTTGMCVFAVNLGRACKTKAGRGPQVSARGVCLLFFVCLCGCLVLMRLTMCIRACVHVSVAFR